MKLNDLKHNHSLTDLLKVLIFSILMLVPFLSVATRSLYVICNKNAKDSYSQANLINQQSKITTKIDIPNGTVLTYIKDRQVNGYSAMFPFTATTLDLQSIFGDVNITQLGTYSNGNNNYIVGIPNNVYENRLLIMNNNIQSFAFTYDANGTAYQDNVYTSNFSLYMTTYKKLNLDNVFEYSIDQLAQSQYYNWTTNTAVFTGVSTMTTQLGITGQTIPILLTYWFMLTIIYVVIDIILKIFTLLTHMLGNKTAK